ncbi:MAG TPA: protein kinase [Bryobacteraceae bacterium]|nr:protein kinase [Bryobacteraceae bacterium]
MTGRILSHYQVLELLGSGGMGEVFKARDTRLNRLVAIKILRPEFVAQSTRKQRFIQEAQAASALNHPNIVTIHDIDQQDGVDFLVMEYIAGRTLDARIPRQGMHLNEALPIAVQIAEGLRRAHAAGIVHRDLKPSNIMVGDEGLVKILDFGLAKLTEKTESSGDATRTAFVETEEGTIFGTTAYMSPEQAEGRKLDPRTDIFSFGVVLYEMLTGQNAFSGETRMATMSAILREEPKPIGHIPPELDRIVRRCLRKDREKRYQHLDDLKLSLEEIREEPESGRPMPGAPPASKASSRLPWVTAGAGLLLAATLAVVAWRSRSGPAAEPYRLRQITADTGLTTTPAISPDGRLLAYASDRATGKNLDIWVHPLSANAQPIRITTHDADDRDPSFSSDGAQIAFYSRRNGGGIYVVPALGGQERLLLRAAGRPRYSPDGSWLAYTTSADANPVQESQLMVMPATGGSSRRIAPEIGWSHFPVWSPDSQSIVFMGMKGPGAFDSSSLWRASTNGGAASAITGPPVDVAQRIAGDDWQDGAILFSKGPELRAMDPSRPGESAVLFTATGNVTRATAAAGKIAFASQPPFTQRLWSVPIDMNSGRVRGPMERLPNSSGSQRQPTATLDGAKLVFTHIEPTRAELRLREMASGQETVLQAQNVRGVISPDGAKVAFSDTGSVNVMDAAGGENTKLLESLPVTIFGWTPDGYSLVYWKGGPIRYFTFDLANGEIREPMKHTRQVTHSLEFTRDRRWASFHIPDDPRQPVYVAPAREGIVAGEREWIRVSDTGGNNRPWWSPDANLLYWVSDRDGFRCVWARRLDPANKQPSGEAFPVIHIHEASHSLAGTGIGGFGPAVSRDRLIFALPEYSGNIWLAEKAPAK